MERTTDVVVVGGGLAGLSAAAYLARGGARVLALLLTHAPIMCVALQLVEALPPLHPSVAR
ncbi:MAG: FAD-binding protein [Bryobacteraceae bacterium]